MLQKLILACLTAVMLTTAGFGADLFLVNVQSHQDADRLRDSGVDAVLRVQDGYLVLADPAVQPWSESSFADADATVISPPTLALMIWTNMSALVFLTTSLARRDCSRLRRR